MTRCKGCAQRREALQKWKDNILAQRKKARDARKEKLAAKNAAKEE